MSEAPSAPPVRDRDIRVARGGPEMFAALDLGTNNCRLLIATPSGRGFRIVDSYSRIVRLGEGLGETGRLGEAPMQRAFDALSICAAKINRRGATRVRAVATQACRSAQNGEEFISRVSALTGLTLKVIEPREEARLAVDGCLNLIDFDSDAVLVLDVGGGSTELSWIDLAALRRARSPDEAPRAPPARPAIQAWHSVPIGVVTLAERYPERGPRDEATFQAMVETVKHQILAFRGADALKPVFEHGGGHLVGTSGAITSLAGLHLGLRRYSRDRVDGLWMTRGECEAVAGRLAAWTVPERGAQPCIGPDRADLVLAGAAILHAVQAVWPCERVRVADRGLREGLLLGLMAERRTASRSRWASA